MTPPRLKITRSVRTYAIRDAMAHEGSVEKIVVTPCAVEVHDIVKAEPIP